MDSSVNTKTTPFRTNSLIHRFLSLGEGFLQSEDSFKPKVLGLACIAFCFKKYIVN